MPVSGFFQQKLGLMPDPLTGAWAESTIKEGEPGKGLHVVLQIGGPASEGAPRGHGVPMGQLLGVTGGGKNQFGTFTWTGAYCPRTGDVWAYKAYAPKAAPRAPAPRSRTPGAQASPPRGH